MNGRNSYLVVGVFVTAGIVLMIVASLVFSGGRSTEPSEHYTLLFHRDISGLTLGAPVRYLGVAVGQVVGMSLVTNDGSSVRVDLEVLQSTPVNSATYASLAFQGVTGVAFISLAADHDGQTNRLITKEFEYPTIPTRDAGLAALLSDAPAITHKVIELLDRASRLLDENNSVTLSRSLANIENFTASLAGEGDFGVSLPDQIRSVLGEIDNTFSQVQSMLNNTEPELTEAIAKLNQASSRIANISARMDGWVTDNDREVRQFINAGLAQMPALIADSRITIREMEKLLAEIRENPSRLVFKPQSDPVIVEP